MSTFLEGQKGEINLKVRDVSFESVLPLAKDMATQIKEMVYKSPSSEIDFLLHGAYGRLLEAMKLRGWKICCSFKPITNWSVGESEQAVTITGEISFEKFGRPQPKEVWEEELLQAVIELGMMSHAD